MVRRESKPARAGTGLSDTDVGRALLAAIGEFDQREYTGSRIILLVSDGGAFLTEAVRALIRSRLLRDRISLYWIHLRSYNTPALDSEEPGADSKPEVALHRFFKTLKTPYQVYEAEVQEDLVKAVTDVGRQQNFPLDYLEHCCARISPARSFLGGGGARAAAGRARVTTEEVGMRRRTVHLAFGAAVLICAGLAAYENFRLREASRTNEAVARALRTPASADIDALGALPEAQFAQAIVLAKQGKFDAAFDRYKAVSRGNRADLATDAL